MMRRRNVKSILVALLCAYTARTRRKKSVEVADEDTHQKESLDISICASIGTTERFVRSTQIVYAKLAMLRDMSAAHRKCGHKLTVRRST